MVGFQCQQESECVPSVNQNYGIKKRCTKCKKIKSLEYFYTDKRRSDGRMSSCRRCFLEQGRKYRLANPEKIIERNIKYRATNPEKMREWRQINSKRCREVERKWRDENAERNRENKRKWEKAHPEISRRKTAKRLATPHGKINNRISRAISQSLRDGKGGRHWEMLVDYTIEDLKKHLEKQFKEGMTWVNIGKWHIDHKIPIAVFNYEKPEDDDFKRCWALDNLQPLWAIDNLTKGCKLERPFQPRFIFMRNGMMK